MSTFTDSKDIFPDRFRPGYLNRPLPEYLREIAGQDSVRRLKKILPIRPLPKSSGLKYKCRYQRKQLREPIKESHKGKP